MSENVHIAGVGVISAIGANAAEALQALENHQAGIGPITMLHTIHRGRLPVAEVKLTNKSLSELTGMPEDVSRTALLAMMAAREAWNDAGMDQFRGLRTGFISANTVGGMDKTEDFFSEFLTNPQTGGRLRNVVYHECGSVTELVADQLGIRHLVTTISTACSSSANSIFFGARLIKHHKMDVVIAGGADALTKFTINGFNTLQILDERPCTPFDENRKGLNLGEGAGYVVLVSEKVAKTLKKDLYCRLTGYSNANDAYHQTASSPDGKGSYLHGTGTANNDISEGTAIQRLFDAPYPKMSSTKSFTGHTLGASGGIEAVFAALSVKHGIVYPNLRLTAKMQALPFVPEKNFLKNQRVKHVLSNSFGFGGNCSSLIFSTL
jgi:3-oxoacyl-(acyl-carrier-protein) synthase